MVMMLFAWTRLALLLSPAVSHVLSAAIGALVMVSTLRRLGKSSKGAGIAVRRYGCLVVLVAVVLTAAIHRSLVRR